LERSVNHLLLLLTQLPTDITGTAVRHSTRFCEILQIQQWRTQDFFFLGGFNKFS
jgi:hypothetical protein